MEMQNLRKLLTEQLTEAHFETLLGVMDQLHDAATLGNLAAVTPLSANEVLGWLDDIIFTAMETVREIQDMQNEASLSLVPYEGFWADN